MFKNKKGYKWSDSSPPTWALIMYFIWICIILLRTIIECWAIHTVLGQWWLTLFASIPAVCAAFASFPMFTSVHSSLVIVSLVCFLVIIDFGFGSAFFYIMNYCLSLLISPILWPWDNPIFNKLVVIAILTVLSWILNIISLASFIINSCKPSVQKTSDETSSLRSSKSNEDETDELETDDRSNKHDSFCEKICTGKALPIFFLVVFLILLISGIISLVLFLSGVGKIEEDWSFYNETNLNISREKRFQECEQLAAGGCLLPWPSSQFLITDNTTDTGFRLQLPDSVMPTMKQLKRLDPKYWNEHDGFSVMTPMMFDIPSAGKLAFDANGTISMLLTMEEDFKNPKQAKTAIICVDTGELVPHFAEIDTLATNGERPMVLINPMVPLEFNRTYVAVVRGVYDVSIDPPRIAAPVAGFKRAIMNSSGRLGDFNKTMMPLITSLLGWNESDLQLAWDWHTYSRRSALGRAEAMRDFVSDWPLSYKITCVQEADCSKVDYDNTITMGRTIWGTFEAPYFMTTKYRGSPFRMRPNDPDSMVNQTVVNKTVEFIVTIPCSVLSEQENGDVTPVKLVQASHTFFSNIAEIATGAFAYAATRKRWILFTADSYGMTKYDVLLLFSLLLGHQSDMAALGDMITQGHINNIVLARLVREKLIHEPALQSTRKQPLYDPSVLYYYGISQGSILGSAYTALSTEVSRAALLVPGASIQFLASRSIDFSSFLTLLHLSFFTPKDIRLYVTLFGFSLEPAEGAGWLTSMVDHPGRNNYPKPVILVPSIGDPEVNELAAEVMARAYHAHTVAPQTRSIPFVDELQPGFVNQSAIIEWRFKGVDPCPANNTPATGLDVHYCPLLENKVLDVVDIFFENATVTNQCGGICFDNPCEPFPIRHLKKANCTDRFDSS